MPRAPIGSRCRSAGPRKLFEKAAGPRGWVGRPGAPPLPLLRPDLPAAGSRAEPTLKRPQGSVRLSPLSRHHGGLLATGWTQVGPGLGRGARGGRGQRSRGRVGVGRRARPRWRPSGVRGGPALLEAGAASWGPQALPPARPPGVQPRSCATPFPPPQGQRLSAGPLPFSGHSGVKGT